MSKQKILTWVLMFLLFFTLMQLFNGKKPQAQTVTGKPSIEASKTEYAQNEEVLANITNNMAIAITIPSACPNNPLRVLAWTTDKFEEKKAQSKINCDLAPAITIEPGKTQKISFNYWNHSLFGELGRYKIEATFQAGSSTEAISTSEFSVVQAGFWRKFFRTVFFQPIYNILVFLIKIAPYRDLGVAIIILTLIIRFILLVPSQRALISQKRMQELQPKLENIKRQYAGNQEKIAQETMKIWKENKVNPLGSCLPLIIQFPVLIALFYVIQNGLNPDNTYLIYGPLKNADLTNIHTNFLGILELTKANLLVLPLLIGALQFLQLKLVSLKKKNAEQPKQQSEMEMANKTMTYIMPVMIALFTASVPAGVGLYWGVSTAFTIGQQLIINRK